MGTETLRASVIFNGVNTGVSRSVSIFDTSLPTPKLFTPSVLTMGNKVINPAASYPNMNDGLIFNYSYKFNLTGQNINGKTLTIKAQPYVTSNGGLIDFGSKSISGNGAEFIIDLSYAKTNWYMDGVQNGTSIVFMVFEGGTELYRWSWQVRGTIADRPIVFGYSVMNNLMGISPDRVYQVAFSGAAGGGGAGGLGGQAGGNGGPLHIYVWNPTTNQLSLIATVGGGWGGNSHVVSGYGGGGGTVTNVSANQIITIPQNNGSSLQIKVGAISNGVMGQAANGTIGGGSGVGGSGTTGGRGGNSKTSYSGGGGGGQGAYLSLEFRHLISNRDYGFNYAPIPVTIIGLTSSFTPGGAAASSSAGENGAFGESSSVFLFRNT